MAVLIIFFPLIIIGYIFVRNYPYLLEAVVIIIIIVKAAIKEIHSLNTINLIIINLIIIKTVLTGIKLTL